MSMTIPTFDKLMLPLLLIAGDGREHQVRDILARLAQHFQLTSSEFNELLPSGRKTKFYDRINWAKTYLNKAGLIENTGRGVFRITERGFKVLQNPPIAIDRDYLMQFAEFADFHLRSNTPTETSTAEMPAEPQQTPDEILLHTYQQLQNTLANDLLDYVIATSPTFFEQLVIDLMLALGYGGSLGSGRRVGQTGDGGIDGFIQEDKLGLDIIYLQAKKWARDNVVGRPAVQSFVGSLVGAGAKKGVFITTSSFSGSALEYAYSLKDLKVILIAGEQLAKLMIEYNVGVSVKTTFVIKQIDENYFPEA
jgi:restriction system protein